MLFTASLDDTFDNSSCDNETYEYRALSQANVHWTYNKGDKTIDMGYQNVERFRETLLSAFEELEVSKCNNKVLQSLRTLSSSVIRLQGNT